MDVAVRVFEEVGTGQSNLVLAVPTPPIIEQSEFGVSSLEENKHREGNLMFSNQDESPFKLMLVITLITCIRVNAIIIVE